MSEDWKQIESKYYMNVVRRQPMVLEKGYGTKIWDTEGNAVSYTHLTLPTILLV